MRTVQDGFRFFDIQLLLAAAAGVALAAAPAAMGDEPPTQQAATAAASTEGVRTADYFPLEGARPAVYVKTTKGGMRRERTERLTRTPAMLRETARESDLAGDAMRVRDSEGEYQDYGLRGEQPALAGQSMTDQGFVQRYEPALPLFPAVAVKGETARFPSTVKHVSGRSTTTGSIVREVVLLGAEDVETPAGRFPGCLKFRVKQENRPETGGSFVARTEETVWLARGTGEVKSIAETSLETFGVTWLKATITLELESVAAAPGEAAPAPEAKGEWF